MKINEDQILCEGEGHSVLLVEDEEECANLICIALRRAGMQVSIAHSTAEACRELQERTFCLVLLDWNLLEGGEHAYGDPTGACVLEEAKRLHPRLPVIVMSGLSSIDVKTEAIRRGAEAFLSKPFDRDVLAQYVHAAARRWSPVAGIGALDRVEDIRPLAEVKREYVRAVVRLLDGNQSEAADRLGISRNTVSALLRH